MLGAGPEPHSDPHDADVHPGGPRDLRRRRHHPKSNPQFLVCLVIETLIAGCSSRPAPSSAFDLSRVQASWTAKCTDLELADGAICDRLRIGDFSADGDVLNVATTLDPSDQTRGALICSVVAGAHYFSDGAAMGYTFVGVRDVADGTLATCPVAEPNRDASPSMARRVRWTGT